MDIQKRYISTRAEEVKDRHWRFIISNETLDRHGSVIKMDGWRLDNYKTNGIVAYQHLTFTSDPDFIIGKGIAYIDGKNLIGEVELEPEGDNEIADKVQRKLKFGTLKMTSVGFWPYSWSLGIERDGEDPNTLYYRDQDLLEWSIVNIPSNPDASIIKSIDDSVQKLISEIKNNTGTPPPEENETDPPTPGPDRFTTQYLKFKRSTL